MISLKHNLFRQKTLIVFIGLSAFPILLKAQIYSEKGKNRYTFAQTTLGYNMDYSPSTGYSHRMVNGSAEKFYFSNSLTPMISITGLHFWGHAEFFTGFALPSIELNKHQDYSFTRSAGTGFKLFPLRIMHNTFRPFIGTSVSAFNYKQGEATHFKRIEKPILFGLTYSFKHGLIELGANYYYENNYQYSVNKNETVHLHTPAFAFSIDYKYFFDTSIGSQKREETGENEKRFKKLKEMNRLSGFSIAVGPAYSFFVGNSSYLDTARPYLDDYQISNVFPDLGLGYYFYKYDFGINLSYRFLTSTLAAFDVDQSVNRKSVALEAYKFLGDYHGFVPFIGMAISQEFLRAKEVENGNILFDKKCSFLTPGIIAGWDIRPTQVDWWVVRTNIRYFPLLQIEVQPHLHIDFQQIEVNFLQFVLYPNRIMINRKKVMDR
jgi:hypothetical protein